MNSKEALKLFISSGFWRAIGSLVVLLVTLTIAKKLGAESSGLYFLSFAIITFLSNISRLGMDNAVLKLVSINYQKSRSVVSAVLISAIAFSSAVGLCLSMFVFYQSEYIAINFFGNQKLGAVIDKMLPYMVVSSWCIIIAMVLQGMQNLIRAILVTNIITNLFLLILLLVLDNYNTNKVAELLFFSILFNFFVGLYFIKELFSFKLDFTLAIKELLTLSKSLFVIVLSNQSLLWFGQIFLGVYGTSSDVSNFAIAQRISMLVSFFLMAINLVVAPKYARFFYSNDLKSLARLVILTGRVNVAVTIPIVVIIIIFSDYFFDQFGNGYEKAAFALIILAVGQLFNAITGSVSYLLSMTGHEKALRNNSLVAAIVMAFLCLSLTQLYGVTGAAVATASSVALNNLLNLISVKKYIGINSVKLI